MRKMKNNLIMTITYFEITVSLFGNYVSPFSNQSLDNDKSIIENWTYPLLTSNRDI